ncbi:hypothetical protein VNO77_19639 [Canavalia gladiata]|uniref:Uncharacterized protein n=1 Tax=Canavalia gladiata TaxID=3824 RepID=A0AAN9QPT7_CANGL
MNILNRRKRIPKRSSKKKRTLKKIGEAVLDVSKLAPPRKLCGYASEVKKAALQKLEDRLLELSRAASGKS